jgi:hypothetical protein
LDAVNRLIAVTIALMYGTVKERMFGRQEGDPMLKVIRGKSFY